MSETKKIIQDLVHEIQELQKKIEKLENRCKKSLTDSAKHQLKDYCSSGNVKGAQDLFKCYDFLQADIRKGRYFNSAWKHLPMMKWLHETFKLERKDVLSISYYTIQPNLIQEVCENGGVEALQWLVETFDLTFENGGITWRLFEVAFGEERNSKFDYLVNKFEVDVEMCRKDNWKIIEDYGSTIRTVSPYENIPYSNWIWSFCVPQGIELSSNDYSIICCKSLKLPPTVFKKRFVDRYDSHLDYIRQYNYAMVREFCRLDDFYCVHQKIEHFKILEINNSDAKVIYKIILEDLIQKSSEYIHYDTSHNLLWIRNYNIRWSDLTLNHQNFIRNNSSDQHKALRKNDKANWNWFGVSSYFCPEKDKEHELLIRKD